MFEWRCGGGGPDDATCDHAWVETGDKSGYIAARDHQKQTRHKIAGLFRDGALVHGGLEGGVLAAQRLGAIPKAGAPAGPAPSPARSVPSAGPEPADGEPEEGEGAEDFGDEMDDGLGDEEEDGEEGAEGETAEDRAARAASALTPRGRRPALNGAYRAWTPYPVLMLNELVGFYFRAWVGCNLPNLTDAAGDEVDEAYFARPVGEVMADWIVDCIQQHEMAHPEQYGISDILDKTRQKALEERERNLAEREAQVLRARANVARERLEVLKYAQELQMQQAEAAAGLVGAPSGGGR